jgi:hypothetical protein
VRLANLMLLLVGFAILAHHFEESNLPHAISRLPPEGWLGGLALLARAEAADRLIDRLAVAAESSAFRTCWFDTLLCLVHCWRAEG